MMPEEEYGVGAFACKICYNRWSKNKQKEKKRRTSIASVGGEGGSVDAEAAEAAEAWAADEQAEVEAMQLDAESEGTAMEAAGLAVSATAADSDALSADSEDAPAMAAAVHAVSATAADSDALSADSEDAPAIEAAVEEPMEEPKPRAYPLPLQPNPFWNWVEQHAAAFNEEPIVGEAEVALPQPHPPESFRLRAPVVHMDDRDSKLEHQVAIIQELQMRIASLGEERDEVRCAAELNLILGLSSCWS